MESKLKQKVNEKKSAVARPWERKLWADSDGPCCFTKRLGRQAELDRYVLEKWINKRVQRDWELYFFLKVRHLSLPHEISI